MYNYILGAVESYLLVLDSFIMYLLPFDVEEFPNGTVVEAFELFLIFGRQVLLFVSPKCSFNNDKLYFTLHFVLISMSLLLKKCRAVLNKDLVFLI
jgi:hypothetical protein